MTYRAILILIFSFAWSYSLAQDSKKDTLDLRDKIIFKRITVVGAPSWKDKTPGAATYIDYASLEKQNHTDINRVLRGVAGINIQEEDGFGLRPNIGLRGTGVERSSKVTLMEDGVLIAPAPYASPSAYYFPTTGRMSAIEIRKGSSQIKYGPLTTGGAINLISTRIPYNLSGKAEFSFGDFNSRKLHAHIGNTYKHFGFLLETFQQSNEGFKALDFGGNTGFNTEDFLGKFMIRTGPEADIFQKLELKIGYYDELSNETYLGLTRQDYNKTPYRRYAGSRKDLMDTDQEQVSLRHFIQFSSNLDITTTLYKNTFNRNWYKLSKVNGIGISSLLDDPQSHQEAYQVVTGQVNSGIDALSLKANNRAYTSQGIQSVIATQFKLGGFTSDMEIGLRHHYDEMDRFQWVDGYKMENRQLVQTSAGVHGTESNRIESARAFAFFLQDKIKVNKNLTLTPGLRYENITLKKENFGSNDITRTGKNLSVNTIELSILLPGFGANYTLNPATDIFTGIHKGFAPPSPGSSPDTKPEESVNYEIGIRYHSGETVAEAVTFFNDYSNLLGSDLAAGGGTGSTQQFNAGQVNVKGLEFSLNHLFKEGSNSFTVPVGVSYTFTQASFQNSFSSNFDPWGEVKKGDELPYLPSHQVNLNIGIAHNNLDATLSVYGTTAMRTRAEQGDIPKNEGTESYVLNDLSVRYQLNKSTYLFTNIRNLFNRTYIAARRPAGLRPGLSRFISGGLKISF